jgi:hypothetical protein
MKRQKYAVIVVAEGLGGPGVGEVESTRDRDVNIISRIKNGGQLLGSRPIISFVFREHQINIDVVFATAKRHFSNLLSEKNSLLHPFVKLEDYYLFAFHFFNLGLLKHLFPLF